MAGLYIILMGVQGSGKGVQADFMRDHYGIPHVSTGDLFRAMKMRTDPLAQQIQEIMESGQLVSDEITNQVVRERLEQPDAKNGAILDGYPRSLGQAQWLENYLQSRGERLTAVLLLDLDLYQAFRRAFGRVTCSSGESYNIYSNSDGIEWAFVEDPNKQFPPRLEATLKATGEKLIRRADDASAHAIVQRIDTYLHTTQPLIDYFEGKGLVQRVDASKPIEGVSCEIKRVINQMRK
ncbi:MAG: nucleoside monophosphate kinase [Chloroflexi bacterium]|nr:nucleoside monophosphate kinase [Chloroflexota bacterium]